MRIYSVPNTGPSAPIGVAGRWLIVINDPALLDASKNLSLPGGSAAQPGRQLRVRRLLVGFDAPPTVDQYDAQVPAHTLFAIPVPRTAQVVYLVGAATEELGWFQTSSAVVEVGIEWSDCYTGPAITRLPGLMVPGGSGRHGLFRDFAGNVWSGLLPSTVLDQDYRGIAAPRVRPLVAAGVSDVVVIAASGVNVLFSMAGPRNVLAPSVIDAATAPQLTTLHRIIVSVGAGCLVVIGGSNLTVGGPGVNEIVRMRFPAAGIQGVEFGNADIQELCGGVGGAWQAYTSVSTTFDATIIGG